MACRAPDDRRSPALETGRGSSGGKAEPGGLRLCRRQSGAHRGRRKRRAALWLVRGDAALAEHEPGGIDVLAATPEAFDAALKRENHTLKRALTDPRLFSGIGNAYSDEILHRARLSPLALTQKLPAEAGERLYRATREVLTEWIERLRDEDRRRLSRKGHGVSARDGRTRSLWPAVSPVCAPVQRIRYADNETNYCPRCQTGGQILADRSLSRLLKDDWPRRLEEL